MKAEPSTAAAIVSPWLTADELARYLKVGRAVIYRAVRKGELKAATVAGKYRFLREWGDDFLERTSMTVRVPIAEVARRESA